MTLTGFSGQVRACSDMANDGPVPHFELNDVFVCFLFFDFCSDNVQNHLDFWSRNVLYPQQIQRAGDLQL